MRGCHRCGLDGKQSDGSDIRGALHASFEAKRDARAELHGLIPRDRLQEEEVAKLSRVRIRRTRAQRRW